MLDIETIHRAKTIIKRKQIKVMKDSSKDFLHFKVKQRSGEWCDVWKKGNVWSCNAVDKEKQWGCVFHTGDKTKPYCSHSLAVKLLLKKIEK